MAARQVLEEISDYLDTIQTKIDTRIKKGFDRYQKCVSYMIPKQFLNQTNQNEK